MELANDILLVNGILDTSLRNDLYGAQNEDQ